jgi:hypothetical protein
MGHILRLSEAADHCTAEAGSVFEQENAVDVVAAQLLGQHIYVLQDVKRVLACVDRWDGLRMTHNFCLAYGIIWSACGLQIFIA